MMRNFKNSPLWLIGVFMLFAEATAGLAAIKIDGWPQAALVIFVISYSSVVTLIFFAFLWWKPENFYGPSEYEGISPDSFVRGLKGIPTAASDAATKLTANPSDNDAFFTLMDNLIGVVEKQHLILMRRCKLGLDVAITDQRRGGHSYQIFTRDKGVALGNFYPEKFICNLEGTDFVSVDREKNKIQLTERGEMFTDWLIDHQKDAETFQSSIGKWGKDQSVDDVIQELQECKKNSHYQ